MLRYNRDSATRVPVRARSLQSCPTLMLRIVALQAPLSMGFSRHEYWSGSLFPPPGDLPDPWIEARPSMSSALARGSFNTSATREAQLSVCVYTHVHMYVYIHTYVHTYIRVYVCVYIYMYICVYMCICVCAYILYIFLDFFIPYRLLQDIE